MKRPLAGLAVVYALGIYAGSLAHAPAAVWYVLAVAALAAFWIAARTSASLPLLLAGVLAAGALSIQRATDRSSPAHVTRVLGEHDQNVRLRGRIVSDTGVTVANPGEPASAARGRCRFELALSEVNATGDWLPATGKLLVFADRNGAPEPLQYGDRIECSALLRVPPPATNPGTLDWRETLERRGIFYTATIRTNDDCTVQVRGCGNPVWALSLRVRDRCERALHYGLENEPELAGVLAGMVIGERSEIPRDTYTDFQQTGVFHVFAVSGLHVGLVATVVILALRLVRVPRRWCAVAGIPLLVLYVFATGARPGAIRALVMAGVCLTGWMLVRPVNLLNCLAAAALVILVADPRQLFDGGFVLSVLAVTSLLVLTERIEAPLKRWIAPDPLLPRRYWGFWVRATERPMGGLARLFSGSAAVGIGLMPFMAVYFHLFTPVGIVANLLVIPMLGSIIALGMLAAAAYGVWPWLTLTLNNANFLLLGLMIRMVDGLDRVPWGHWFVQAPPAWLVAGYYVSGLFLIGRWMSLRHKQMVCAVAVPVAGLALLVRGWRTDVVELTVLDLEQGVAVFLNVPGERNDWLIDGGDHYGARQLEDFLRGQGVDRLGAIVLTHGDKSHAGGLAVIAQKIPVGQAIHSGRTASSPYTRQWLQEIRRQAIPLRRLEAGEEIQLGEQVRVSALSGASASGTGRSRDDNLVLSVRCGPARVLLTSDAGATVERTLLAGGGDLRADVLVKGRSESEPSGTVEFLEAVQPQAVVITGERRAGIRYPEPELPEWLERHGGALYRTADLGAVTIRLDSRGWAIHTCREAR